MRAFKSEIDALTTRSRFAEGSFLALYKLLREAPDPAVTVQALEKAARAAVEALEGKNRWVGDFHRQLMGMCHTPEGVGQGERTTGHGLVLFKGLSVACY